jgi:hypothetical protein
MKTQLTLVGDTNLRKMTPSSRPFARIQDRLNQADVLFGNCENCFSDPTVDLPYKAGWFHTDRSCISLLASAGFDAVGCANNVTYGEAAICESLECLDGAGIQHAGAGKNREAARRPALVQKNGITFGFLSYTSVFQPFGHAATENAAGVATIKGHTAYRPGRRALEMPGALPEIETWADEEELDAMRQDISALKSQADVVVQSCHWGVSSSTEVTAYQRQIAHAAIAAGVDIIIGHHPHVIQGVEIISGKPVFYSLGNFVFGWEKMQSKHRAGLVVECDTSDGHWTAIRALPIWRDEDGAAFIPEADSEEGKSVLHDVQERSQLFETQFDKIDQGLGIQL